MLSLTTIALFISNVGIWHKVSSENYTKKIHQPGEIFYVKNTAVKFPKLKVHKPLPILLTKQYRDNMYELLQTFVDVCKIVKIPVWISGGTLLGLIRQGTLLPFDDDIDLHTLEQFKLPLFQGQYANTFRKFGLETFILRGNSDKVASTPGAVVRFRLNTTKCPVLDLLFVTKKDNLICKIDNWSGKKLNLNQKERWHNHYIFPIKTKNFLHLQNIPVPNKPQFVLKKQYGDEVMSTIKARHTLFSHAYPYQMLPYMWKVL